jgi:hypothetical protein
MKQLSFLKEAEDHRKITIVAAPRMVFFAPLAIIGGGVSAALPARSQAAQPPN